MWCKVVTLNEESAKMRQKLVQGNSVKARTKAAARASITFPSDLDKTLEQIAQQKNVPLAWVIRDAAEKYAAQPSNPAHEET